LTFGIFDFDFDYCSHISLINAHLTISFTDVVSYYSVLWPTWNDEW